MVKKSNAIELAIQANRAWQDSGESAQVRHSRRDDRPQGQGPGQHPAAAARHSPLPLRQERLRRCGAGRWRGRERPSAPGDRIRANGTGQAGSEPGSHVLEVEVSTRRVGRRSWATNWNCPASSPRAKPTSFDSKARIRYSVSAHRPGVAASLQAARTSKLCVRQIVTGFVRPLFDPYVVCPSVTTAATAPGRRHRCPRRTPPSST